MLKKVIIHNYRSLYDAEIILCPFTLLLGANGSGKSNLLRLLSFAASFASKGIIPQERHINHKQENSAHLLCFDEQGTSFRTGSGRAAEAIGALREVKIFSLNPEKAGISEALQEKPTVAEDGSGTVRVLDSLKTGDREDLFDTIERKLREYIPEVEKLSFLPGGNNKRLQVREKNIKEPIPVSELSEGTRLILILLTILYQERPPSLICLEEMDRGLHPRLFQQIVELCFELTEEEGCPQIIATTHNPYMVDLFKDREDAVVLVEKKEGYTTLTTLEERLEGLDPGENPLGELWFSGALSHFPPRRG